MGEVRCSGVGEFDCVPVENLVVMVLWGEPVMQYFEEGFAYCTHNVHVEGWIIPDDITGPFPGLMVSRVVRGVS